MPSPYPIHYTLRWPFYYHFPSMKKHIHLEKMPLSVIPTAPADEMLELVLCGDMMVLQKDTIPTLHSDVCAFIASADAMIGNCEAPLGNHKPNPTIKYRMKFDMSRDYLSNVIDQTGLPSSKWYLSVANNHISDYGYDRMMQTKDIMQDMGINPVGFLQKDSPPLNIVTINNLRVGMIAWTDWVNCKIKNQHDFFFAERNDIESVDWALVKKHHHIDLLIALPHWEYEFQQYPRKSSQQLAHALFSNNAVDLLVGAHTHMLQPMEKIEQGYCFYNLGNFFGLGAAWPVRMAPLLKVFVDKKSGRILGYDLKVFAQVNGVDRVDIVPLSEAPDDLREKITLRLHDLFQC